MISGISEAEEQLRSYKIIQNIKQGIISREIGLNIKNYITKCHSESYDMNSGTPLQPTTIEDQIALFQINNLELVGTPEVKPNNVFNDGVFKTATQKRNLMASTIKNQPGALSLQKPLNIKRGSIEKNLAHDSQINNLGNKF